MTVGAVDRDEAIEILARDTPRNDELDRALGDLAETVFRWVLLLTLAAAELHRDDELGWGADDDNTTPRNGAKRSSDGHRPCGQSFLTIRPC